MKIHERPECYQVVTPFLEFTFSKTAPAILSFSLDSLGKRSFPATPVRASSLARSAQAKLTSDTIEYRGQSISAELQPRWSIRADEKKLQFTSHWSPSDPPEPLEINVEPKSCRLTLLGRLQLAAEGSVVSLPAVLHVSDRGSFRVKSSLPTAVLGYDARRSYGGKIVVTFPPSTEERPEIAYQLEVCAIYPTSPLITDDAKWDGLKRSWLNIFQINARLRVLANNSGSDTCAFCQYEYADMAVHTPPLAEGLTALDLVRLSLDRYLEGMCGYGIPGYSDFDLDGRVDLTGGTRKEGNYFLDVFPSLLIAAGDYVQGSRDLVWLKTNYPGLRDWADSLLAMDKDQNGLFEYALSGNSGTWTAEIKDRPANWWDTIGFGHEDAYSNALAYRALLLMANLSEMVSENSDAARYRVAAEKLRAVYYQTFFNPETGVLAGWKSRDGQLHDYYFLFVNGMAIHYGLVEKNEANAIMDRLLAKMKDVGYNRFDLGLPGNLIPVLRKDYVHCEQRWGGGEREDNLDGFQIYENGGATACHAYFTLAVLYDLNRQAEADQIFDPMLKSFDLGEFQGTGPNGMTKDWKAWDGTTWGYEGFLVDNYYALLAALKKG